MQALAAVSLVVQGGGGLCSGTLIADWTDVPKIVVQNFQRV